jgi:sialate O-acetylesterase
MKSLVYDKIRLGVAVLLYLCATSWADAKVKLPALISDGMVLQREQSVKVWGTADAGENITIEFQKKSYHATADANGQWSITLPPLKAGGPFLMQINDIKLNDILVGDVWLCSGQSNMELPVKRVMDMFSNEILNYNNEKIRHILIPQKYNFHAPQEEISATSWKTLTQKNVMEFSALAYFFAKEMYEKTGIPVGLINSSWGGTPVEAWISEEGLKEFPLYINSKRLYEDDAYCSHIKKLEAENFYRWNLSLYRSDAGLHESTPWYATNYDDNNWQTVNMFSQSWGNKRNNPYLRLRKTKAMGKGG